MQIVDVRPLRALVQVASDGSISRAARTLGLTQQALSARLRAFERELDVELLQRSARGTVLSAQGDLVVVWARDALAAMDRFNAAVASLRQHSATDLVVAVSQTVAAHLLPAWVAALHGRQIGLGQHPSPVVFDTVNSDEVIRKVHEGECALGFIESPNAPHGLGSRGVHWDSMVVAVGLQWAPPWMVPANLFVLGAALYSVTCMEGLSQPWTMLVKRLADAQVQSRGFGGIYIASGRVKAG